MGLPGWHWDHYKERNRSGQDVEKRNACDLLVGMQTRVEEDGGSSKKQQNYLMIRQFHFWVFI